MSNAVKYFVEYGERLVEVEVLEREGDHARVRVDGREIDVDAIAVGGGELRSLLIDGESHRVSVREARDGLSVAYRGRVRDARVETERDRWIRSMRREGAAGSGPQELASDMAEIVVRLLVSEGDTVENGDPLLTIEAMKMENEIRAPSAGRVAKVHVGEKDTVLVGDKLVTLSGE